MIDPNSQCPCGKLVHSKPATYSQCCQVYHLGAVPSDVEDLMRSRYSAFCARLHQYLIDTHHPDFLAGLTTALLNKENNTQWLGLEVQCSGSDAHHGQVEFHAWYRDEQGLDAIHEVSDFVKQDGRWWYTQGKQLAPQLPKRNAPCICRSGKKFKQCCL